MKSKPNWLDVALNLDVRKYIRNGRRIMKMQKFTFAVDKESYLKLGIFIDRLESIRNGIDSLEVWREWASKEKDDSIYEFISTAPDILRQKLEEITYDRNSG